MAKNFAETSTKNVFVFLFILNLKIKNIDKLGFIPRFEIILKFADDLYNRSL